MENDKILEMKNISKTFPGVKALAQVSLDLYRGEVLGLLGENGAGKSTLIKILAGTYNKDSGEIYIDKQSVQITSPAVGKKLGIRVIYQELSTLDYLSVSENIFLGDLPVERLGRVNWRKMKEDARDILKRLRVDLDPSILTGGLTTGQKQIVEIARALAKKAKILVMDEPTAALGEREEEILFYIIQNLKVQGISVIYISHKLSEIFRITDRVAVLRDGRLIGIKKTSETNKDELVKMMVGRELTDMYPKKKIPPGDVILEVNDFGYGNIFRDVNFDLRQGEILGFFGLAGSGQTALLNSIFGAHPRDRGTLFIEGREVDINHPSLARKNRLGLVPISRKEEGVTLSMSVENNITMANIGGIGRGMFINKSIERERSRKWVAQLNIKTPSLTTLVDYLSGGNQQKVVLAKWLESGAGVFILNEPTRGIDVGSKVEIYMLMEKLCEEGNAVIMSSTELMEIISIPDRIIVMAKGRIAATFNREEADKEKLVHAASL